MFFYQYIATATVATAASGRSTGTPCADRVGVCGRRIINGHVRAPPPAPTLKYVPDAFLAPLPPPPELACADTPELLPVTPAAP
jgi:hypothetical protein